MLKRLTIKQKTKLKLFKLLNKILFCKLLRFHLPIPTQNGFTCIICEKQVPLKKC